MRYLFLLHLLVVITVVAIGGYRGEKFTQPPIEIFNDMDRQAKIKAQKPSGFFADGVGARKPVPGTVPLGYEIADRDADGVARDEYTSLSPSYYYTGRFGDYWGDGMPSELGLDADNTAAFLRRGQERYNIYCTACHGESGNGQGVVMKAGFANIANLHLDTFQPGKYADGALYNTIANGKGLMGAYGDKLTVRDRWAVVAWVRVLQDLAEGVSADDPAVRELLEGLPKTQAPATAAN